MTDNRELEKKETDLLVYKGNNVPGFIRFVWTVLAIFCIYYLAKYAWPDLKLWINKSG